MMTPDEHLEWFEDNIAWYEALPVETHDQPVPACPGWNVGFVLNHLGFGLGIAYPVAMAKPSDTAHERAFDGMAFPPVEEWPSGRDAAAAFTENMRACLEAFRNTPPDRPGYTYAGPGLARFWFRRAAVETSLHLLDVASALGLADTPMTDRRAADGVAESVEFSLPIAAEIVGQPTGRLVTELEGGDQLSIGEGSEEAQLCGPAPGMLAVLWGRPRDTVEIRGDDAVAADWLSLAERAFAGR